MAIKFEHINKKTFEYIHIQRIFALLYLFKIARSQSNTLILRAVLPILYRKAQFVGEGKMAYKVLTPIRDVNNLSEWGWLSHG